MRFYINSSIVSYQRPVDTEMINLIQQFYIPADYLRKSEIKECLQENIANVQISKIYLLNERIYSREELGITTETDKVVQINLGRRLFYRDVFDFVDKKAITGYIVISNSDIVFNNTLKNLHRSDLQDNKLVLALTRFEKDYSEKDKLLSNEKIVHYSQDTWIYHSNFNPGIDQRKIFNYSLGIPGCDNKIVYLLAILGYKLSNDVEKFQTIHIHQNDYRSYSEQDRLYPPYMFLFPTTIVSTIASSTFDKENVQLYNYLTSKISQNKNFIIPRISGIETSFTNQIMTSSQDKVQIKDYLPTMKINAGIKISSKKKAFQYAKQYLYSLKLSDLVLTWDSRDRVYPTIKVSQSNILKRLACDDIWAHVLDVYHYINYQPWTLALKGQRLLIISAFVNTIQQQIPYKEAIYGFDLFPDCSFVFIKPPQTNGDAKSREFDEELADLVQKIREIRDNFDIALCSCGGYGNLVCAEIFKMGKSAIYVGGVLQMYFGILGSRWELELPEIVKLYKNEFWTRAGEQERPEGFQQIEQACYW